MPSVIQSIPGLVQNEPQPSKTDDGRRLGRDEMSDEYLDAMHAAILQEKAKRAALNRASANGGNNSLPPSSGQALGGRVLPAEDSESKARARASEKSDTQRQPNVEPGVHEITGNYYGTLTIKGNQAKVIQGNVFSEGTDPATLRKHHFTATLIESEEVQVIKAGDKGGRICTGLMQGDFSESTAKDFFSAWDGPAEP